MKRFISIVSLAALLGVSLADSKEFLTQQKLAKMACYMQKNLNVFDLTYLAARPTDTSNVKDYSVVMTDGSKLVYNLCQYTQEQCAEHNTFGYIQNIDGTQTCLTSSNFVTINPTVTKDSETN
jgi:hypothetical protein